MHPQIFETHQDLAPFVKCYWTLESSNDKTPKKNTIVPDGSMKMIFHYGDPYKHYPEKGKSRLLPKSFVIGQLTHPYTVEPTGDTGTFFVCFHPNGFLPFTTMSLKQLENKAISLKELFGMAGEEIEQKILEATTTSERIASIETFLFSRLTTIKTIDTILQTTVETILTANGQLSVHELSSQNNINRRQLLRKFSTTVGLSPKQLSKTMRLQHALKILLSNDSVNLTELAYENEYYDQSHFIKEFKEFTGITPKEFYGEHLKMSLIFEGVE